MAARRPGRVDGEIAESPLNEAKPRQSVLQDPQSATSSNNASPSTPSSPNPLLNGSYCYDVEDLNGQEQFKERDWRTRFKLTFGPSQSSGVSSSTPALVPEDIRPVSLYHPGYGRLAAIEDCDPDFLIYRRFGWLHSRILLNIQDELQELERELEKEDEWEYNHGQPLKLRHRRKDCKGPQRKRQDILAKIHEKLKDYDALIFRLRDMKALKRPSQRNQGSLYQEVKPNIVDAENAWILRSNDLVALAHGDEHGWFNGALENVLGKVSKKWLLKIFRDDEQEKVTGSMPYLNLVSPQRFDILLKALLAIIASLLLLGPVTLLFELQPTDPSQVKGVRSWGQILVVFFFTLTFSACCSIFTKARKQEIFTATAAYSAVLVVFLGNTSQMLACANNGS